MDFIEIMADNDASYDKIIKTRILVTITSCGKPHSPDNVDLVSKASGLSVDQVCIGSCTNSFI